MSFIMLGSFPNSQVRPRPVTQVEYTYDVNVPLNVLTLIAPENANRTFVTIKNNGPGNINWGTESTKPDAIDGFELGAGEGIDIETPENIYVFGAATSISVQEGEG